MAEECCTLGVTDAATTPPLPNQQTQQATLSLLAGRTERIKIRYTSYDYGQWPHQAESDPLRMVAGFSCSYMWTQYGVPSHFKLTCWPDLT